MTHYVPASTETNARLLSDALFALAVPRDLQPSDGLQDAFEVLTALNGSPWLVVPDEFTLVMHPEAEINGMADVLQPYEAQGYIPAGTIAGFETWINATRVLPTVAERTFCPWDKFPVFFKGLAKSWQGMVDAGLLALPAGMP